MKIEARNNNYDPHIDKIQINTMKTIHPGDVITCTGRIDTKTKTFIIETL